MNIGSADFATDETLADYFEPIKADKQSELNETNPTLLKNHENEHNNDVSIIEYLSNDVSKSNSSVNQINDTMNISNINHDDIDDLDSIASTESDTYYEEKLTETHSLQHHQNHHHPHPHHHLDANSHSHSSFHLHSQYSHLLGSNNEESISVEDFFFNNPNKTTMPLSNTTSLDDVKSLSKSVQSLYQEKLEGKVTDHSPLNESFRSISSYSPVSLNSSTIVKPKSIIKTTESQQTLVTDIHKGETQPKLSSMRIRRSFNNPSSLRNLKTSSIITLDDKLNNLSNKNKNDNDEHDDNEHAVDDDTSDDIHVSNLREYQPDRISEDFTKLMNSEEGGFYGISSDCDKVVPFGGFSRPHKFSTDKNSLFRNAKWEVVDFKKGNMSLINSVQLAQKDGAEKFKWVGTTSVASDIIPNDIKENISNELKDNYDSEVVFLDDEIFQGHYQSFCKQILWPIFHYQIPDNPNSNAFENKSWKYYEMANQIFADKIAKDYKDGDTVWIHDYHLMLVPSMLRKLIPHVKIGFFLHISFPSSEVFRCLAQRKKILEGMLGADCITFQNEEYMAHFLQCSNRLLLADFNEYGVFYKDHLTVVSYNPIGLDFNELNNQLQSSVVANWKNLISKRWSNKKLIVSRDKIDKIRGLKEKLLAYERFLNDHPEYINDTILILICINGGTTDDEYKNEVLSIVERINSRTKNISTDQPIILLNRDIEFEQYIALLAKANLFIVSTLREGMNLTCHEFICATQKLHSPLILSEFVGSAFVLNNGPFISNPYNIKQVSQQIYDCLNMNESEKTERWSNTFQDVLKNDSKTWVKKCLEDINLAYENLNFAQTFTVLEPLTKEKYDNGFVNENEDGKKLYILNLDDITAKLEIHGQVINSLQQQLIDKTLYKLSSDPNNDVFIFSLFQRSELLRMYRRLPAVGLIAENGGLIKLPRSNKWFTVIEESEKEWIPSVVEILNSFCERLPGSYIEVEECTVIFHTDNSSNIDKDYRNGLIGDLITHINELFSKDYNIHASISKGLLVIKEMNLINKSLVCISQQTINNENITHLQLNESFSSTTPVFQTTMDRSNSSSHVSSPILTGIPMQIATSTSSLNLDSIMSSLSPLSEGYKPYKHFFIAGSNTRIDEELYTFFNTLVENNDSNDGNVISVCVGKSGKQRISAKYSLKGINNLMTLLD